MKVRESNFELLRIISMFFIVAYHTFEFVDTSNFNLYEKIFFNYFRWYGLLGVNLFLLISAYFMIDQQMKSCKLFSLILQVAFYCMSFAAVFIIYSIATNSPWKETFMDSEMEAILSPLWSNRYWFISAYVFLYLLMPLLNRYLHKWDAALFKRILTISTIIIFLYMTLPEDAENKTVILNVIWVVYVYLIMAYLKLHTTNNIFDRHGIWIFLVTWTIFDLCRVWLIDNEETHPYIYDILRHTTADAMRYSFPTLIMALALFHVFQKIHFKNKCINYVASCVFGIYLFHENKLFHLCEFAYTKLFKPFMNATHLHVFIYMFVIEILMFTGGILVEMFRKKVLVPLVEKPLSKPLTPYFDKIDYIFNLGFLDH